MTKVEIGKLYRHVRRGTIYRVLAIALEEATHSLVVVYEAAAGQVGGEVWTRPHAEFIDGRFEPAEETPALKAPAKPPAPHRAHEMILNIGADTREDLVHALNQMIFEIKTGQLTAGCSGAPGAGSIYAYRHDPAMTHDAYFQQLEEMLERERAEDRAKKGVQT